MANGSAISRFCIARYSLYFIHSELIHFYHISIVRNGFAVAAGDGGHLLLSITYQCLYQLIKKATGKTEPNKQIYSFDSQLNALKPLWGRTDA